MANKPVVLAVDDKPANLLALEALLSDEYEILAAASGPEAVAIVSSHRHIDVILMDVQMPVMDGFEAAQAIKKLEEARDIPIIFVTAVYTEDPHVRRGYEVGGIDYFGKPFDPEVLRLKMRIYSSFRAREKVLHQRERAIRESEELVSVGRKLAAMLESLTVGVLIVDTEGRICQITDEVARIFKAAAPAADDLYGEILGWWTGDGALIRHSEGVLQRALQEGVTSHAAPLTITCVDGSRKDILASASPLRAPDARLVGAVVLVQDMTGPRQLEEDLERRVTNLVEVGVALEESAVRAS